MKLSDLRGVDFGHLEEHDLIVAHRFLKAQFYRAKRAFDKNNLRPQPLATAEERLQEAEHIRDNFSRLQSEASAFYHFFYTRVPGALSDTRAVTSTVQGYKATIRETGRTLGIHNYSGWSEEQRQNLWDLIDRVRELGADRFLPTGYGSYLYQSGTSFRTISIIIEDLRIDDPVEILSLLDDRIRAVEQGNTMTDREFFGI